MTLLEWALADDSRMVRIEAAKGVGLRGNAGSIPKLEPLLKDDHNAVRCMAAAAIIRLGSKGPVTAASSNADCGFAAALHALVVLL